MPIVRLLDDRQVAGQERIGPAGDADRDREQHRVDGLGHEQVRDPLDVGDDPPALGDDAGHGREVAVEQHDLRDGARRGRTRCPSRRRCRRPSARARRSRRRRSSPRCARGLAARRRCAASAAASRARTPNAARAASASASRSSGSSRASNAVVRARDPDPRRDRADRARVVARDDHAADALLGEVRERLGRVGRGSAPRASTSAAARARREEISSRAGASVRASSSTRRPLAASSCRPRHARERRAPASTISGAPSTHVPRSPNAAALHLRADENGTAPLRIQPSGAGNAARDGSGVALPLVVVRERAERGRDRIAVVVEALDAVERDRALGERAGLVEAHDVDARQALDRGELLHEHLVAARASPRRPRTRGS